MKSRGVFIIGPLALLILWIPALPYSWGAADLPAWLCQLGVKTGWFKATEIWHLRVDYIAFPVLVIWAICEMRRMTTTWEEVGLTFKHFMPSLKDLLLPTLAGAVILLLLGWGMESLHLSDRFWKRLFPIPALLQQMVIQIFFHQQLIRWFGAGRKTACILTLYFVALHLPNPGLMLGTAFGMYFWARNYQKHPNLYTLAISHAFLSALLMECLPKKLLPSVSVGYRFIEKGVAHQWWGWF